MSNAQAERAFHYLLSAKQTKAHFSRLPDDENNRKLKKQQLTMWFDPRYTNPDLDKLW
jgi:hypothetical protein